VCCDNSLNSLSRVAVCGARFPREEFFKGEGVSVCACVCEAENSNGDMGRFMCK